MTAYINAAKNTKLCHSSMTSSLYRKKKFTIFSNHGVKFQTHFRDFGLIAYESSYQDKKKSKLRQTCVTPSSYRNTGKGFFVFLTMGTNFKLNVETKLITYESSFQDKKKSNVQQTCVMSSSYCNRGFPVFLTMGLNFKLVIETTN